MLTSQKMTSNEPNLLNQPAASTTATSSIPAGPTVFVGNLSFSTNAEQLTELFGGAEKVQSVRLIKKYGRFKGYGFVSFNAQADADQAVQHLNGKDINGREMKVQPASEPKPIPVKPAAEPAAATADASIPATNAPATEKKAKKPRSRKPKKRVDDASAPAAEEPTSTAAETSDKPKRSKKSRGRKPAAATDGSAPVPKPRSKSRAERTLNMTALFVGSLPYEVDDEDLRGLFVEFKVESARVVRVNGRSKGFGFVYFADEKSCSDALHEFEGALLEGRALIVMNAYKEQE